MAIYFKHRTETDLELRTATVIAHKHNTVADKEIINVQQTESATAQ